MEDIWGDNDTKNDGSMDIPIIRMRVKSQGQDWGDDDKGMVIIYDSRVEDIWVDDDKGMVIIYEDIWVDDDKGMVIIYDSRVEDIWGDDDTDKKMTAVWTSR